MPRPKSRQVWPPEPGLFAVRITKGGWRVPARIVRDPEDRWQVEIDGQLCAPHADPAQAEKMSQVWHGGVKIDQQTYDWLGAVRDHARASNPAHPALHPDQAVNYLTAPPLRRAP